MAWETALLRKTRHGGYKNCLDLIDAYADFAPWWERALLAFYAGVGPPLARCFGSKTKDLWRHADEVVGDLLAVSGMSPHQVAESLRKYVRLKRGENHSLPFETARESIYDQPFYPLVTHFTLAFQPSAVARLRFVRRIVESIASSHAAVADLGCGSGAMLCEVLRVQPGWTGYGLDISEAAINYARRLAAHKDVAARVRFQTGCLLNLPFASNSLDVVIASEVVEHLPNPERVFAELSRVLAPGGLLLVTVPVESHTPAHMHALNSAEDLCALLERAGLAVSSIKTKWHVSYGDDRKHVFAVAEANREVEFRAQAPVYSLSVPHINSAASSGIVSS
ncbi:MAG: class I SAM-dependent methyltransferase [Pyrinomonadaceae bacterium]|nr:class I SAM-dependent methyltransferase [Pyrinomonadaceae bacterium]